MLNNQEVGKKLRLNNLTSEMRPNDNETGIPTKKNKQTKSGLFFLTFCVHL